MEIPYILFVLLICKLHLQNTFANCIAKHGFPSHKEKLLLELNFDKSAWPKWSTLFWHSICHSNHEKVILAGDFMVEKHEDRLDTFFYQYDLLKIPLN